MNKPLILLVDDSPLNLEILGNLLEGTYITAIAKDGVKALEFVKRRLPDLILLDVMMPDLDGFEVCTTLKASPDTREIPVIFLTAKTETEDLVKGFHAGAVDYITKPFQKEELLARIATHLALRQAQTELQMLNATKDRFFSIIAHDLRTPFTGLLGLTDVILQSMNRYDQEKLTAMLRLQHDAVTNLFALLENLLTWSRIQRKIIEFREQPVNLCDVVKHSISLLAMNAVQKQITMHNIVPGDAIISGDLEMVDTVIRNVLSNAVKFTNPGGSVTIAAAQTEQALTVSVTDTGIGIDPDGVSKLFRIDAHYRRPGTADEKGTGLGLILCKEFAEWHGGRIWVESDVGRGTTFHVMLPNTPHQPQ